MNKTASKFLAILLTLAMLFSLATLALAHDEFDVEPHDECVEEAPEEEVSVQATCKHQTPGSSTRLVLVYHKGTYLDSSDCIGVFNQYGTCELCNATIFIQQLTMRIEHRSAVESATCTGTVQTWHNSCYSCGKVKTTETHPCPGASHVGSKCLWLPI